MALEACKTTLVDFTCVNFDELKINSDIKDDLKLIQLKVHSLVPKIDNVLTMRGVNTLINLLESLKNTEELPESIKKTNEFFKKINSNPVTIPFSLSKSCPPISVEDQVEEEFNLDHFNAYDDHIFLAELEI